MFKSTLSITDGKSSVSIDLAFILFFAERDVESGEIKIAGVTANTENLKGVENIRFPVKGIGWALVYTEVDTGGLQVKVVTPPLAISIEVLQPLLAEYLATNLAWLDDFISPTSY